ncbi:SDR family oxidoreductase [Nitratireductor kimnyeongensis]|nr:SDR family NAD(P)-dependent oxidoreductase [Nitratireductor kimnyeongensis]QZZ36448.1 SDR family oxidoreductase [Nitratireductor kimnyeongensis]
MNPLDLNGKIVVLSGACGALGVAVVNKLSALGARVAALDIVDPEVASSSFEASGNHVTFYQCDAADEEQVAATYHKIISDLGMPDTVCCHTGIVHVAGVENYALADFDELIRVNLRGAFVLAQRATKVWLSEKAKGNLIFTSSWVQDVPWPELTPYNTSKSGMKAMMRGFARELASRGIRANSVAPGIVGAGMALKMYTEDADYKARTDRAIPLGYMQKPDSVANAFAFLTSDMSDYMTGATLVVDGGCSLYPNI